MNRWVSGARVIQRGTLFIALLAISGACALPTTPECPDRGPIQCDVAALRAMAELPAEHQPVTRIQFVYGCARPCRAGLLGPDDEQPVFSHVVFTYDDRSRQYVDVVLAPDSSLSADGPFEY